MEATHAFYRARLGRDDLRVGMVVVPQRFGDRVNPHIHLHVLSTDGVFDRDGLFYSMPFDMQGDIEVLERLFARRVLDLMVRRKRLSVRLRDEMLTWEHNGFSVDGSVKVAVDDYWRLRRLVRYLARPAVSAERVAYDQTSGTVTVRSSKKVRGIRPVVAQYDVLTFMSLLALQVPPPGVHMVRSYGHYSVRSRVERRRRVGEGAAGIRSEKSPPASERRRRWAELIRLMFEVDPMRCERCGGGYEDHLVHLDSPIRGDPPHPRAPGSEHGRSSGPRAAGVGCHKRAARSGRALQGRGGLLAGAARLGRVGAGVRPSVNDELPGEVCPDDRLNRGHRRHGVRLPGIDLERRGSGETAGGK